MFRLGDNLCLYYNISFYVYNNRAKVEVLRSFAAKFMEPLAYSQKVDTRFFRSLDRKRKIVAYHAFELFFEFIFKQAEKSGICAYMRIVEFEFYFYFIGENVFTFNNFRALFHAFAR